MDEFQNLLVLVLGLGFLDQIDLVLQDEDVLEFHDLDGGQMLRRLRLRTRLVSGCGPPDKQMKNKGCNND